MTEPILTREETLELAVDAFGIDYDRLDARFENYARAIEAAVLEKVCGEPRAWLVEGGRMFQEKSFLREANADTSIAERNDGARKTALFALTRSKP
jgi:hypothetical protein